MYSPFKTHKKFIEFRKLFTNHLKKTDHKYIMEKDMTSKKKKAIKRKDYFNRINANPENMLLKNKDFKEWRTKKQRKKIKWQREEDNEKKI